MTDRAPHVLVSGVLLGQPMGGVRRHNQELLPRAAERLARRGGSLSILEGSEALRLDLPADIERIPSRVPAHPPLMRALAEGRALRRTLSERKRAGTPFDVVHTAHLPAPRELGTPLCFTLHDPRRVDLETQPVKRLAALRAIRKAFQRAACVVAVSSTMARRYREEFGASEVRVVPNAADHLSLLARATSSRPFLLHVGHLEPRKNLELLLGALALAPELPQLVLAGAAKGDEAQRLQRRASELGIESRLELLGPVSDDELARLYSEAACVVLPSKLEGFGIPALEAVRAGVPLAVSDAGALREVAGEDVPHFDADDPRACAEAISRALSTSTDLLGRRARAAARSSWDASADELVAAWSSLARTRTP